MWPLLVIVLEVVGFAVIVVAILRVASLVMTLQFDNCCPPYDVTALPTTVLTTCSYSCQVQSSFLSKWEFDSCRTKNSCFRYGPSLNSLIPSHSSCSPFLLLSQKQLTFCPLTNSETELSFQVAKQPEIASSKNLPKFSSQSTAR